MDPSFGYVSCGQPINIFSDFVLRPEASEGRSAKGALGSISRAASLEWKALTEEQRRPYKEQLGLWIKGCCNFDLRHAFRQFCFGSYLYSQNTKNSFVGIQEQYAEAKEKRAET